MGARCKIAINIAPTVRPRPLDSHISTYLIRPRLATRGSHALFRASRSVRRSRRTTRRKRVGGGETVIRISVSFDSPARYAAFPWEVGRRAPTRDDIDTERCVIAIFRKTHLPRVYCSPQGSPFNSAATIRTHLSSPLSRNRSFEFQIFGCTTDELIFPRIAARNG